MSRLRGGFPASGEWPMIVAGVLEVGNDQILQQQECFSIPMLRQAGALGVHVWYAVLVFACMCTPDVAGPPCMLMTAKTKGEGLCCR